MKKNPAILFVLFLIACTQEPLLVLIPQDSGKEFVLDVSVEEPSTKSGVSQYGSFYWTSSDQLAIYTTNKQFRIFKLKDGFGLPTATFSGNLDATELPDEIAVYPAQIASSYDSGLLTVILPTNYKYDDDYSIGIPPMIATLSSEGTAIFKHLCAMLRFTIDQVPRGASSVRLYCEGSKLTGAFNIQIDENNSISRIESDTNNTVTIDFAELDYPKTMTFSFPVPAGTYDNLVIEILNHKNQILWTKRMSKSRSFKSGQLMAYDTLSPFPTPINLGLPSGTLWANMNVGASSPTDTGLSFAWGEIEPKDDYTKTNYLLNTEGSANKYNSKDNLIELEASDDAAVHYYGNEWQMPTKEQMQELYDICEKNVVEGVGYIFKGPNGNSIFLPFGGTKYDGQSFNFSGSYWSKTVSVFYNNATALYLYNYSGHSITISSRYVGRSVRPVYIGNNSFSVSPTNVSLFEGENKQLDVLSGNPSYMSWKSENETVAEVSSTGLITAKAEGITTIVISSGGMKQSCVVRVVPNINKYITVSFKNGSFYIVDDMITSRSKLSFSINNGWNRAIKVLGIKLLGGQQGEERYYKVNESIVKPNDTVVYQVQVTEGMHKPITCECIYACEGKEYSSYASVPSSMY